MPAPPSSAQQQASRDARARAASQGETSRDRTEAARNGSTSRSSGQQGTDSRGSAARSMADQQRDQPSGRTPSDSQLSRDDKLPAGRVTTSLNNRNPTLGNQDKNVQYGVGTAKKSPVQYRDPQINGRNEQAISRLLDTIKAGPVRLDPSIMGRNEQARRAEMTGPGGGVQGGQGIVGYEGGTESGINPNQDYTSPEQEAELDRIRDLVNRIAQPRALDPSINGRNEMANRPGAGVPDLPNNGMEVAKTPGARVSLPTSPPGPGNINDLLNGLQSGWEEADIADPRVSYPSDEGQVYSPAGLGRYDGVLDKLQDQVGTRSKLSPGQVAANQTVNNALHRGSMLNASRVPPASAPATRSITAGPETPAGPEDWQSGDQASNIDPTGYSEPAPSVINGDDLQQRMDLADPDAPPEKDLFGRRTMPERIGDKISEKFQSVTDPVQRLVESFFGKPDGIGRQPEFGQGGSEQRDAPIETRHGTTDLNSLLAEMQAAGLPQQDQMKLILSVFA